MTIPRGFETSRGGDRTNGAAPSLPERRLVVVLGMHRSGTSVVARGLGALGVPLGDKLMRPVPGNNEKGFFEDLDIYALNERLLTKAGAVWHSLSPLDPAQLVGPLFSLERREAVTLLSSKLATGRFGFKDPRTAVLLPFWTCVFEDVGVDAQYVIAVRNPLEAAASLEARDGIPPTKGLVLWAKHMFEAVRHTEGGKRIFVAYDRLLADPNSELERLAAALNVSMPASDSDAITAYYDEFLTRDLRHHRISSKELRRSGLAPEFVIDLYEIVIAAAAGDDGDVDRWRDAVAGYDRIAPLLAYADRLDRDRATQREQSEKAVSRSSELEEALHRVSTEAQAASQARDDARQEVLALRSDLEHQQRIAKEEHAKLTIAAEEAARAAEEEKQKLIAAAEDAARAAEEEKQKLIAAAEDIARVSQDEQALLSTELERHRLLAEENRALHRADVEAHSSEILRLEATVTDIAKSKSALETELSAQVKAGEKAAAEVEAARQQIDLNAALGQRYRDCRRDLLLARAALTATRQSTSWRVTAPLRAAASLARNPIGGLRAGLFKLARAGWRRLPMPPEQRGRLAQRIFSFVPALRRHAGRDASRPAPCAQVTDPPDPALEGFVPLLADTPPQSVAARVIAFYLPQFHPTPENDRWWGKGFTEWTKVCAAEPRFDGHYQPHEPGELGYYDLVKDVEIMRRQAELARLHGIEGFCFYFYWFAGKRLLEEPIRNFSASDIDLPFCLCWANENWTRRWDGRSDEILIAQEHSPDDDTAFIAHVSQYFNDKRYIRINGRPLLIVYRPALLPSAKATAERWRLWLREHGMGDVYLACTQAFEHTRPEQYGFDAAIEFPPNNMGLASDPKLVNAEAGELSIYDWSELRARARSYTRPDYTLFRGVTPQWDNTPRRPRDGAVFVKTSPSAFSAWVADALRDTAERFPDPQQRLIFVNAWNEWAEGAHLEPDRKHGYAWLEAMRRALVPESGKRKLLVVTHDLHRHGAQYLALNLARTLRRRFGFEIASISGHAGALGPDFENEGSLTIIGAGSAESEGALAALVRRGFRHAIVNSAASGWIAPQLARHDVRMIGLVHELPTLIENMGLARALSELDRHADALVFPAATVRDKDASALHLPSWRSAKILPQGLYKAGAVMDLGAKGDARRRVLARLRLPQTARIVLGVGYADERKAPDIFIAWATAAARRWPHAHFVWIGAVAPELKRKVKRCLHGAGAQRANLHFPGFIEDTGDFYAAADLYALCSREDPFPSTALEAMAAATPVITVRGTGGIEELEASGGVRAIASAEPATFVDAAADWLSNPLAARAAGEQGRDFVCQRSGFATYAGALTDLLGLGVPNVSVVVPNYNYARFLERRLDSILGQTLSPREIIFLDDASSDNSIQVAERLLARAPVNWRIVRNRENSGDVFAQWRKGAALAQGDLAWIAEADDWADSRFLETATRAFQRDDVVLSMTQSQQAAEDGRILAPDYLDYVRDVSTEKWRRPFIGDGQAEVRDGLSIKNTIPNVSAVVFRRSVLLNVLEQCARDIGSYRVAGDWCVYANLLRQGALAYSPAALNYHRRHDASVTNAKFDLPELAEIARMQAYVAREFAPQAEYVGRARAYLESLVKQFGLDGRWARREIEGAMRGVAAA